MREKVAVLFSGGVESSCLLAHYCRLKFLTLPVYVRCGFSWEITEYSCAQKLWLSLKKSYKNLLPIRVVFLKGVRKEGSLEIPLRNFFLVSAITSVAVRRGIKRVAVGSLGIYPFPDNNRDYFDTMERLISTGLREEFRVETPFMSMEKGEIINRFKDIIPLQLTFSCIKPVNGIHCGKCEKCMERKEAFVEAGIPDPTRYAS